MNKNVLNTAHYVNFVYITKCALVSEVGARSGQIGTTRIGTKHNPYFWIAKSPDFENMHDGYAQVTDIENVGLFEGSLK